MPSYMVWPSRVEHEDGTVEPRCDFYFGNQLDCPCPTCKRDPAFSIVTRCIRPASRPGPHRCAHGVQMEMDESEWRK